MKLLVIFLIVVSPIIILPLVTRRYRNIFKLYMVFGKKGSGKSTFLIKKALYYKKKGFTIYTNMLDCMIDDVRIIDLNKLGDFVPEPNSVLLCDEVGMQWDARDFKNFKTSVRDFFKYQRHYHVICYLSSQTFDIDKKLRDLVDAMYLSVCLFNVFSISKRIQKKFVLTEATSEAESRISENLKFRPIWEWEFTYIPKYAKFFDSFVVPPKPYLPYHVQRREIES